MYRYISFMFKWCANAFWRKQKVDTVNQMHFAYLHCKIYLPAGIMGHYIFYSLNIYDLSKINVNLSLHLVIFEPSKMFSHDLHINNNNNNKNNFISTGYHIWHKCQSNIWSSITITNFAICYCYRRADGKYCCLALETCMKHRQAWLVPVG